MALGLLGTKCGMTRVFAENGKSVAVTVIEVKPNRVTLHRTLEKDGYQAIQVASVEKKTKHTNKAAQGLFSKAGVEASRFLREFTIPQGLELPKVGSQIPLNIFTEGQKVDVTGTSKGKGFAGVVKRWNFQTQDATHGNSLSHRAPGSIGQNQTPGRVFKNKKMAGHLGSEQVTTQTLELFSIDEENNLLLIAGAVPGATGSLVVIKPAVKAKATKLAD